MSRVEYASKPGPVFAKLVVMLRNIPAMQFVLGKLAALLRKDKTRTDELNTRFADENPDITPSPGQQFAVIEPSGGSAIAAAAAPANDQSVRENLIRRRWAETGIKMWNPDVHGAGHAALGIQGGAELLPPKAGDTLPQYDRLEFKLIEGRIVCEGFVVDPPQSRRAMGPANAVSSSNGIEADRLDLRDRRANRAG
jgi:hypothetical protein